MRTRARILLAVPLLLAAAACGGTDDAAADGDDTVVANSGVRVADTVEIDEVDDVEETGPGAAGPSATDGGQSASDLGDDAAAASSGGGTAVLTLENGETHEFDGVMCTLEPQTVAGSVILFTATSYGVPGLDITQFGDEGSVAGVASIEMWDADYETLWEAFSFGGSNAELTLEGTTIRGSGDFYDDGAGMGEPVRGEIVANC